MVKERDYIRNLIESSPDFQMTLDKGGKIRDVNEAFEHIAGKRREDIIGTSICQYMQEETEEAIAHLFEVEKVRDIELTIDLPGEKTLIGNFSGVVFTTPEGEFGIYITGRDITDRKKTEEALKESQRYTRGLIEVSLDPLVTISSEGKITDVNHATELVTGHPREKLIGTHFSDYFTDPQKARQGYQQVFREGYVQDYPLEIKHRDGKVSPVLYNASVYYGAKGDVAGVFAAARDITDRKKVEEALKESQRYTRGLIEVSLDPLVTISSEGKITDVNHATELVTGNPREKLIGADFSQYFTDPQKARQGYQQVFRDGYVQDYPLEIKHRDGKVTPVLYNASVYYDAKGDVAGVFAAARDITDRKKAEDLLRNAEEDWRNSFNALEDVMLIIGKDYNIENINDTGLALLGKGKEEVIGKKCYEIIHGKEEPVEYCPHLESLKTKKVESLDRFEKDFECYFSIKSSPIFDEHGEIVRFVDLMRDITEHKRVEQELRKRNDELNRFNKLAVGRELRMIELKSEINALLEQLGKEPRYRIAGEGDEKN